MSIADSTRTDFQYRGVALASERNKFQFYNRIFNALLILLNDDELIAATFLSFSFRVIERFGETSY